MFKFPSACGDTFIDADEVAAIEARTETVSKATIDARTNTTSAKTQETLTRSCVFLKSGASVVVHAAPADVAETFGFNKPGKGK